MKRVCSIILTAALLASLLVGCGGSRADAAARDVPAGAWYGEAVDYCTKYGLMTGTSATSFAPDATTSRAMLVTVLARMDGAADTAASSAFSDVASGAWYAGPVAWAAKNAVVAGYPDGGFHPNEAVTREQAAAVLWRFAKYKNMDTTKSGELTAFTDADEVSAYALDALRWGVGSGLFTGDEKKQLTPGASLTRAQTAALLMRFAKTYGLSFAEVTAKTPFETYGRLTVTGNRLTGRSGETAQLRGVSTHGLAWYPQYVNEDAFRTLRDDWGCSVVRLAMYTAEYGGYCSSDAAQQEKMRALIDKGVQAATNLGMYVIIDWHILSDGNPNAHVGEAKAFFAEMAQKYGSYGNVLYEICNEPNGGTSWQQIKTYAAAVLPVIRQYDSTGVVLVGTPTWSQDVDLAAADPLTGYGNVMYTLHFYAATHRDALRAKLQKALNAGLPVFVSEFGVCDASGNGGLDTASADTWMTLLNKYGVSWCCWSLSNKNESSALLLSSTAKTSGWTQSELSAEGKWLLGALGGSASAGSTAGGTGTTETPAETGGTGTGATTAAVTATGQNCALTATLQNSWSDGSGSFYQYAVTLKNTSSAPIDGWTAALNFSGPVKLSNGWNGSFTVDGSKITVTPADYNRTVAAGAAAEFGFIVSGAPLTTAALA